MKPNEARGVNEHSSERYEKLYTMLLDTIPSSVLLIDRDMRISSANRNFLGKSRRSISNTIGRRLEEIFPVIILDNVDITYQIRRVFEKNQATRGQRMTYRAPGVPMSIYYYRIVPFSWKGTVENVVLLMDDVTEQIRLSEEVRRVERHLASVVDSASDIVLSTDMGGTILSWNPAAEKISGYRLNEVRGRFFHEFLADDHWQQMKKVLSDMKAGKSSHMAEWDIVTRDGERIRVYWVCSPMKDEQPKTVGIVAVGRDLTERRKLEVQLVQSQKFAALGVMAGGIAHEIRNPLAVCSSAAQFLMDDDITPEFFKECADKIYAGIERASIIIENLLRFARPSAKYEIEQINLSSLIRETLTLIANEAKLEKIKITSHIPREPVVISGNFSLLQQAFINLFLNGIKSMPRGGTLSLSMVKNQGEVSVSITDTGDGISGKDLDKIFDPFYTTSPVGEGTGLGLSICYSVVKQHFGTIEVDSIQGKGSTFTVKLPVL